MHKAKQWKTNTCLHLHLEKHEQKTVEKANKANKEFAVLKQQADVSQNRHNIK